MALKSKEALGLDASEELIVLADKGYHTGEQMQTCHDNNIKTIVAVPRKPKQTDHSKPAFLRKDNFTYNKATHTYTCPSGQTLSKQARYKRKTKSGLPSSEFDRYAIKNSICKACAHYE